MTVSELRRLLANYPGDANIMIERDAEDLARKPLVVVPGWIDLSENCGNYAVVDSPVDAATEAELVVFIVC